MEDSILQTVDRALMILEMLSVEGLTATDIQIKMKLNKSTVHRLMMTLLNRGFVERDDRTGIYHIGIKMVEIASIRLNQVELKTEALPYLHRLANKFNQSVQLAILDDFDAVYIEKVEKYQSFHMYCQTGKRIPLYCSAVGKSLLLDKSDYDILSILDKTEFEPFTANTRLTKEAVLADIHEGRKNGYTRDEAEHEEGVFCIAMPIYDYRGQIVAAASITGFHPDVFLEEGIEKREALRVTCLEISRRLGYLPY